MYVSNSPRTATTGATIPVVIVWTWLKALPLSTGDVDVGAPTELKSLDGVAEIVSSALPRLDDYVDIDNIPTAVPRSGSADDAVVERTSSTAYPRLYVGSHVGTVLAAVPVASPVVDAGVRASLMGTFAAWHKLLKSDCASEMTAETWLRARLEMPYSTVSL